MQEPRATGLIQDAGGVPLGRFEARRELLQGQVEWIRAFLIGLKTNQKESKTVSDKPKVNQVWLSGQVKSIKINEDNTGAFFLVDSETEECRWIPCTIFKSAELVKRLQTFASDEYIKIVGMIRAWSKKVGERQYDNRVEVRVTEIKNTGTVQANRAAAQKRFQSDEEPF